MSFPATVLKAMNASPADVPQERRLIREVVYEWNAVQAEDRGVVLQPVGWETHAAPQMGDRAQAIINKQVLAGCDLLVATFWTRLGSPTGAAASGTVEEIEDHIATGKPAAIYFSSAPVRLESVDPSQYEALTQFERSCRSRGLVEEYDDLTSFREKFSRHLAQTVIRLIGQAWLAPASSASLPVGRPPISREARELLLSAAEASDGMLMQMNTLEGLYVQANNGNHAVVGNPRSEARWRAAIHELVELGYLEDRLGVGEVFNITETGYVAAEATDLPSPSDEAEDGDRGSR